MHRIALAGPAGPPTYSEGGFKSREAAEAWAAYYWPGLPRDWEGDTLVSRLDGAPLAPAAAFGLAGE